MNFEPPAQFNIAEYFLDARIREGKGKRTALLTDARSLTYHEVQELANRFGNMLSAAGVDPEQRVIVALPDGPEFAAALFGVLKIGAVVIRNTRRVSIHLSTACPDKALFRLVAARLEPG